MQNTSTQRLAEIEADIHAALAPLMAEDPVQALRVMEEVARLLSEYVAEITADGASEATRALAREHLLRFVGHGVQLLEQIDLQDAKSRLN